MESTQTLKLINVDIIYIFMQYHPSLSEMIIVILSDFIHELITISFSTYWHLRFVILQAVLEK